jgi:hypothetical protein
MVFIAPPGKKEDKYKAGFYVGTQADKLAQAFDAMNDLIENMPESEKNWDIGRTSIKQNYRSQQDYKNEHFVQLSNGFKKRP